MNDAVYHVASFMLVRNPHNWRWSHARQHTDIHIVGRDPEIAVMRPPEFVKLLLNLAGLLGPLTDWARMLFNATGQLDPEEATDIPAIERPTVILIARIWLAVHAAVIAAARTWDTILPLMVIGLPSVCGVGHYVMTGLLQHGGLTNNVVDHRLNSRTPCMNPVSRFIHWNRNYQVEHHMFPMVPCHALPRLHQIIKHDLPAPSPSILAAWQEMWPVLRRQLRHEGHFLRRDLPPIARPYREKFHRYVPGW